MLPSAYPVDSGTLRAAWQRFTTKGVVDEEKIDPAVARSWHRCAGLLNPWLSPRITLLSNEGLEKTRFHHFNLIAIARPFMEDIHQFVEGSGFVVCLWDSSCCLLELLGDEPILREAAALRLTPGAFWDEPRAGTNAFALALLEGLPVQVVGAEHFFVSHHIFTDSAAPLHDVTGRLIGVLGMIGREQAHHPHTLGIVMAAAKAIENQLQTDLFIQEANQRLAELNTVVGTISDGLISWDAAGIITHFNTQAGRILGINPGSAMGHPAGEVLQLPTLFNEAIHLGKDLNDEEVILQAREEPRQVVVSLRAIRDGASASLGAILTLKRIEQVRQLVHHMVGARAQLTFDDILGEDKAMRHARRQARIAAKGSSPILLLGESGTGKDRFAQAIHRASKRADGPFIVVNCAALPRELVMGEFLGYGRGAFNAAVEQSRPGKLELAHGGTIYLNEVDSLPLEMQASLLQVIETGMLTRLRGERLIPVDVRIIAASDIDLAQRVDEGSFLADLFYHLNVFTIYLPPLRDRGEDLHLLIAHLGNKFNRQQGRNLTFAPEALAAMEAYPWPGNVRELENVVEQAMSLAEGDQVTLQDLPPTVRERRVLTPGSIRPTRVVDLQEAEREAILRAGWAYRGNLTRMAQALGIGRTTLWRKMKSLNLPVKYFKGGPGKPL